MHRTEKRRIFLNSFWFSGLVECVFLGTFSLLCGCTKNTGTLLMERSSVSGKAIADEVALQSRKLSPIPEEPHSEHASSESGHSQQEESVASRQQEAVTTLPVQRKRDMLPLTINASTSKRVRFGESIDSNKNRHPSTSSQRASAVRSLHHKNVSSTMGQQHHASIQYPANLVPRPPYMPTQPLCISNFMHMHMHMHMLYPNMQYNPNIYPVPLHAKNFAMQQEVNAAMQRSVDTIPTSHIDDNAQQSTKQVQQNNVRRDDTLHVSSKNRNSWWTAWHSAMQIIQENPRSINTLRISIDGKVVNFLLAILMFGEDDVSITSFLNKGIDIKAADQEGVGILHVLIRNRYLSDQQKASLVDACFDRVACADDISTTTVHKSSRQSHHGAHVPWMDALRMHNYKTAFRIIHRMSIEAAEKGLYIVMASSRCRYSDFNVGKANLLQYLLDKQDIRTKALVNVNRFDIRDGTTRMHLWEYAWRRQGDAEKAIHIIQRIPYGQSAMSHTAMASQANKVLASERKRACTGMQALISSEWQQIKAAFIAIGVPKDLLDK